LVALGRGIYKVVQRYSENNIDSENKEDPKFLPDIPTINTEIFPSNNHNFKTVISEAHELDEHSDESESGSNDSLASLKIMSHDLQDLQNLSKIGRSRNNLPLSRLNIPSGNNSSGNHLALSRSGS
jgi:ribosome-binding ATPase YchF (GTP1/OBG family)